MPRERLENLCASHLEGNSLGEMIQVAGEAGEGKQANLCPCPRWVALAWAHRDIREYKLCFRVVLHHSKEIEASYSNPHQSLVREHLAGRQRSVQNAKAVLLKCLKLVKAKAHKGEPSKHIQTWEKRMLGDLNEMCKIILICSPRCKFSQL